MTHKITAWFTDTSENFLCGLEWEESKVRFTKYHFNTIKNELNYLLDECDYVYCDIKIDGKLVIVAAANVVGSNVYLYFANVENRKPMFRKYPINTFFLSHKTYERYINRMYNCGYDLG